MDPNFDPSLITKLSGLIRDIPTAESVLDRQTCAKFENTPLEPIVLQLETLLHKHRRLMVQHDHLQHEVAILRRCMQASERGSWVWNIKNNAITTDAHTRHLFGFIPPANPEQVTDFVDRIIEPDRTRLKQEFKTLFNQKIEKTLEFRVHWPDNSEHAIAARGVFDLDEKGHPFRYIGVCWDITERQQVEQQIHDILTEFKTLSKLAPIGILQVTASGHCLYANDFWYQLCLYKPYDVINKIWYQPINAEFYTQADHSWYNATLKQQSFEGQFMITKKNHETAWIDCKAAPLPVTTLDEPVYLVVVTNISKQKHDQKELERLAHFDPLTGLHNRASFMENLTMAMHRAKRHQVRSVLFFLDLDGFKHINDTLGHEAGDHLLQQVAYRLVTITRVTDIIGRLGGDEFVVFLEHVEDYIHINASVDKIFKSFAQPFIIDGQEVNITTSIGAATSHSAGFEPSLMLRQADMAMYQAKEQGKNCYQYFTEAMNTKIHKKIEYSNTLSEAIQKHEIKIHLQPTYQLDCMRMCGVETTLRWFNQRSGGVSPDEFIPIAEENGLILGLTEWLMAQTFQQVAQIDEQTNVPEEIHISLFPRHFTNHQVIHLFESQLQAHNLPPELIVINLSEDILMLGRDLLEPTLDRFVEQRYRIALAGFGIGSIQLSDLNHLPLSQLKLHPSLIENLHQSPSQQRQVEACIALAHALNLELCATGIDHAATLAWLTEHHCDRGQGPYLSKPIPLSMLGNLAPKWSPE